MRTPSLPARPRIKALDIIRGFLIIGMMLDHLLYDCVMYLDMPYRLFENPIRTTLHYVGAYLFVLLSGASSYVSRSNWKRGVELLGIALLLTLITWIGDHDYFIVFGILHLLAVSTLLYALCRPLIDRIPRNTQLWLWILLIVGSSILTDVVKTGVPGLWILGFPTLGFFSTDYYPLLPWLFVYLLGTWTGPLLFEYRLPSWFYEIRCNFLEQIGRHSLWVYLLHQPIILGAVMILADILSK